MAIHLDIKTLKALEEGFGAYQMQIGNDVCFRFGNWKERDPEALRNFFREHNVRETLSEFYDWDEDRGALYSYHLKK